jgi:hypothetical protein
MVGRTRGRLARLVTLTLRRLIAWLGRILIGGFVSA